MDNRVFAVMMANLCTPQFAKLILQVPTQHTDEHVQHRLISSIAHGSQMAAVCHGPEAFQMIYETTEHLFKEATSQSIQVQEEAHRVIVSMVAHASGMARVAAEAAGEIFATVRPMANEPLPNHAEALQQLNIRLDSARRQISDISHSIIMARTIRNVSRQ